MLYSKELQAALQPHFIWHGARLTFLSPFLITLFKVHIVSRSELIYKVNIKWLEMLAG